MRMLDHGCDEITHERRLVAEIARYIGVDA